MFGRAEMWFTNILLQAHHNICHAIISKKKYDDQNM